MKTSIQHISFWYCCLDMAMFDKLSEGMKGSKQLETFQLRFLPIVYTRSVARTIEAVSRPVLTCLSEMQQLKTIDLSMGALDPLSLPLLTALLMNGNRLLDSANLDICCWTNDKIPCTRQVTRFIVVYANLYEIMAGPHYACMAVATCPLGCECTPG